MRVLIVDDSAAAQTLIAEILRTDPVLEVVGVAGDGYEAVAAAERLRPSVITMDLVMPRLDGLEAIRRIMASCATPIVVVAAAQASDSWVFQAMEAGALTVLEKPTGPRAETFDAHARRLISAVKTTAGVTVRARLSPPRSSVSADGEARRHPPGCPRGKASVVAFAASTGGPPAIAQILRQLPGDFGVPILIAQHISRGFERGLASWLDEVTPFSVRVARDREPLRAGEVLIAGPDGHLGVNGQRATTLSRSPAIAGFRPSATYLFRSLAEMYCRRSLGVMLTGMGSDGADGLLALKRAGGSVIVQDEASSVVFGMPRAAISAGAAESGLPLADIPRAIVRACGYA